MVSASGIDFFRHASNWGGDPQAVRPGRVYRYTGSDNVVRIAKVIDVRPDALGIPHVRFEVRVGRGLGRPTYFEETRTLNLDAFVCQFREAMDM